MWVDNHVCTAGGRNNVDGGRSPENSPLRVYLRVNMCYMVWSDVCEFDRICL